MLTYVSPTLSAVPDILAAYALRDQRFLRAAARVSGGPSLGEAPGPAVAPAPQPGARALCDAVVEALRLAGDEAAVRKLLVDAVEQHMRGHRRTTLLLQAELNERWTVGTSSASERLILPRFVPIVVDTRRTVAAAIGGAHLSNMCYRLCRARIFIVFQVAVIPAGYGLFLYILSTRGASAQVYWTLVVLMVLCNVANALNCMLLNTTVLRSVVLGRFDTWWSIGNVLTVAILGSCIFKDSRDSAIWFVGQIQMSLWFFQDASPPSSRARKIVSFALVWYAAANCYSVLAIWSRTYDVQDVWITVLGVPLNLKHWTFSSQLNTAVIVTRFAVRALADKRNLMFVAGLRSISLAEAEARELVAVVLAEQNLD